MIRSTQSPGEALILLERTYAVSSFARYLVDEHRFDVNGMDATVAHACPNLLQRHWGTPSKVCTMRFAARSLKKGAPVVKWLLERGADPSVKHRFTKFTSGRNHDAFAHAKEPKCDEVLEMF